MNDILFQLFCRFPTILLAEVGAIVFLTRLHIRGRLIWVIGSYLLLLSAALAVALTHRDEFGYSFIPAALIAWPWFEILQKSFFQTNLLVLMFASAGINCAIFYLIERVSNFLGSGRCPFL